MHAPVSPEILRKRQPGFLEFVAIVALMMGVTAFGVDAVLPALPALGTSFSVADPNELQLVVYTYMLGFGLTQLVYGPLADVIGRRPAFLAGMVIFLLGCVLTTLASSLSLVFVARFVQGMGAAAGRVLAVTIVRDRFAGREMARVMSLTMMIFIMVPVLAPTVGGLILLVGGWRLIFGAMLVVALLLSIWFAKRMPETLHSDFQVPFSVPRIWGGVRRTATHRVALGYATAFGLLFGCIMSYVGSAQQIFVGLFGLGALFPIAFGSVAVMMGVAALVNSRMVRRYGMHRISHASLIGFVCLSVAQCATAFVFGGHPPLVVFGILLGLSHFASSLSMPNFNALAMEPLGEIAGTASSLIGFYTTIVGALAGMLVGHAFDGTVLPLSVGYLVLGSLALGVVLLTERGRLFHAVHAEPR